MMIRSSEVYDLSIIIPTVGRAKLLLRAIYSVIAASGPILTEIIVVDDSTDGLKKALCDELLKQNHVRIIRSSARNAGAARNAGVRASTADVISFLDDDDSLGPMRLYYMYKKLIEKQDVSFISTGRLLETNQFEEIALDKCETKFGNVTIKDVMDYNIIDIGIMCRKELFESVGGFDENLKGFEDWDLIIQLLSRAPGLKLHTRNYFVNNTNSQLRVSVDQEKFRAYIAQKHKDKFGITWANKMNYLHDYSNGKKISLLRCLRLCASERSFEPMALLCKQYLKNLMNYG